MTESANSGIFVQEGPVRGQRLVVRRESVAAFVGTSPRGPVGIPVALGALDEFRRRFGASGHRCRAEGLLAQFFENGGTSAIFVRVSASERRHHIVLPGAAGDLILTAANPGPFECLRASIDYDGIPTDDDERFNLVIHRLASREKPIVEEQEIYRAISIDPGDPDYIAHALTDSALVAVSGRTPLSPPALTRSSGVEIGASYQYADDDWHEQSSLTDYDLIGCDTEGIGIFALDRVPIVDLVCLVPDAGDLGPVALFAADRYCQSRHALLLIDPPSQWTSVEAVVRDRVSSVFSSPNVVTYYPRPEAKPGSGLNRSPSLLGALVGRLVASDAQLDSRPLVGDDTVNLRWRDGLSAIVDDRECTILKRQGVNALRQCTGGYVRATDMVTMDRSSGFDVQWSELRKRRVGLFIVGSIARGTRWAAFDNDGENTWRDVRRQIANFMSELFDLGALSGRSAAESWYVIRDCELFGHPDPEVAPGYEVVADAADFIVGFALRGCEFTAFRFTHDRLDCRVDMVGWQPGVALAS